MKKLCSLLAIALVLGISTTAVASEPAIKATAAVLIDAADGSILYQKAADQPLPPASCCKILTAITVLDNAAVDEVATISAAAAAVPESGIWLQAGEQLAVEELLYGALLKSGNDACWALAEQTAGSEPLFVSWLNLKAASVGALSATMRNCNGLPAEGHQISAYDLALCARYALNDRQFAELVATKTATIPGRSLKNTNKLLWQDERIIGVKTGTTDAAGACLVAALEENGRRLIAVVYHSPDRYGECLALFNYGLQGTAAHCWAGAGELVAAVPLAGGGLLPLRLEGQLYASEAAQCRWQLPEQVEAPVQAGEPVGWLTICDRTGQAQRCYRLVAAEGCRKKGFSALLAEIVGK